jgi:hypothetical protein
MFDRIFKTGSNAGDTGEAVSPGGRRTMTGAENGISVADTVIVVEKQWKTIREEARRPEQGSSLP